MSKIKVGETMIITLTSCEYDCGGFKDSIHVLREAVQTIEDLGYECDVEHTDDLVDESELLS